ncbi:LytR/AlgR family response regulator transcription factor [Flavihumibacter stibioxidans]|uniref:DNA-binding response regulator n=1 Tax=Flavihumibacter stibioxidans TaxID=1834163 RepID=A0ABR7MDR6_9BACT|nr:LytTR family DNA-binding domain-containing protein [Flavihumibacter stibioxidans]MBC6492786.1 DNA-binding response regulator [Flavihumibacter stibioxidans]
MKVVIIEDEQLTANRLQAMLKKYDPEIEIQAILPSVSESVEWFKTNPDPALIFMDIHLEDGQSFSIFEKINLDLPVIFTTAYDEYMVQAFKVNSVDYLMKPVNYDELARAIDKYKRVHAQNKSGSIDQLLRSIHQKENGYKERFMVSIGSKLKAFETDEINYFFSADKLTFLVTADNIRMPIDYSLDKLVMMLNPKEFFRINRQMMVRLSAIQNIHVFPKGRIKLDLIPEMKEEVMVSLDKITPFKEWLGK